MSTRKYSHHAKNLKQAIQNAIHRCEQANAPEITVPARTKCLASLWPLLADDEVVPTRAIPLDAKGDTVLFPDTLQIAMRHTKLDVYISMMASELVDAVVLRVRANHPTEAAKKKRKGEVQASEESMVYNAMEPYFRAIINLP